MGHAHMTEGVETAYRLLKSRIRSTHIHDNNGKEDSHLFPLLDEAAPSTGRAPWRLLRSLTEQYPLLLELTRSRRIWSIRSMRCKQVFERLENLKTRMSLENSIPPRIPIAEAGRHAGETVEIAGWLYNLRRSGKICFPQLRDGTGIMQCVAVKSALPEELFESLKNLTQESSLIVRGKVRAEARAAGRIRAGRRRRGYRAARLRRPIRIRSRRKITASIS